MKKDMINVTEITEYLFCPRKLYLKKIKKLKQPQTDLMVKGMIKHKILENFSNSEEYLVSEIYENIEEKEILKIYQENLNEIIKNLLIYNSKLIKSFNLDEKQIEREADLILSKEIELRIKSIKNSLLQGYKGRDLWENLAPKYLSEYSIESENLGIKGRIDRIKIENNTITPFELKTRADIYDSDKIQLAAYALLLEDKFKRKIENGIIETKDKSQEISLSQDLKNKVLEIAENIRNFSEDSEPNFQNNFNKCRYCPFEKECFE